MLQILAFVLSDGIKCR